MLSIALFYYANYYYLYVGYPDYDPFPILWSLAVEEHYYIIFPFCMLAFRHNLRSILPWLAVMVATALAWRMMLYNSALAMRLGRPAATRSCAAGTAPMSSSMPSCTVPSPPSSCTITTLPLAAC